jgi:hypothetical protein
MTISLRLSTVIQSIFFVKYGATDDKEVSKFTKPNR